MASGRARIEKGKLRLGLEEGVQGTFVSAKDLRTKTRDILERAKFRGEHFVVESFGKPMVAIIGSDEYRAVPADAAGSHSSPDRCQTWRKSRPPYLDCDG